MSTQALATSRFVRKTQLAPGEYRKNFHQIDCEILSAITSPEADQITPLMSKIYLRIVNAPERFWEREGVLRIGAEVRGEKLLKAWAVLCEMLGVAGATASKAIAWMHEQGIIGYFSGKNGVGMRIFLNRANSSIGLRNGPADKKILAFPPASIVVFPASANEAASNDSFAVKEISDQDINPVAPKNGADSQRVRNWVSEPTPPLICHSPNPLPTGNRETESSPSCVVASTSEIVERLKLELEPDLQSFAARVAAQVASREIGRTREWFESKALPKAVRVAQRETYELLRKLGHVDEQACRARSELAVGRSTCAVTTVEVRPLTRREIQEAAETCVALLEAQGKPIEATIAEFVAESGGWLAVEDAPSVLEAAEKILTATSDRG